MKSIKFIEQVRDSHTTYHLPVPRNGFLRSSIFPLRENVGDSLLAQLWDRGITHLATGENSLLYALVVRLLTGDVPLQLIYLDSADAILQVQHDARAVCCEWCYCLEYTVDDHPICREFGFQNPKEFLQTVNYSEKNLQDRYFFIATVDPHYLNRYIRMYHSDVTNWSFVTGGNVEAIRTLLCDTLRRPTLPEIFELAECMVHVQIGEDEGYLEYVLVQSKRPLNAEITKVEQRLTDFVEGYDALLAELGDIDSTTKLGLYQQKIDELLDM